MAKPTKESAKAMEALDSVLQIKMVVWNLLMKWWLICEKGFSGLTEDQKSGLCWNACR